VSIKKDISDGAIGAIGAEKSNDGLTSVMMAQFGGAVAGVKNVWVGAMDRTGSALRDIGAAMMEPFVSAMGGGAAVAWAIGFADILRNFLALIAALSTAFAARFASAVDTAFAGPKKIAEAFKMDGAPQAFIALLNGEFTPALPNAFNIEEDSPVVGLIMGIRSGLESIKPLLVPIIRAVVAYGGGAWAMCCPLESVGRGR